MAMYMYVNPLTHQLNHDTTKQILFADDVRDWWDCLTKIGPDYGYFPEPNENLAHSKGVMQGAFAFKGSLDIPINQKIYTYTHVSEKPIEHPTKPYFVYWLLHV